VHVSAPKNNSKFWHWAFILTSTQTRV
jgi:hypothetical protein